MLASTFLAAVLLLLLLPPPATADLPAHLTAHNLTDLASAYTTLISTPPTSNLTDLLTSLSKHAATVHSLAVHALTQLPAPARGQPAPGTQHFFLYGVNRPEGFNLRRDVLLRALLLLEEVNRVSPRSPWTLVLPPYRRLRHWREHTSVAWHELFDLDELAKVVPVMEYDQFVETVGTGVTTGTGETQALVELDRVVYLRSKPFDSNRARHYPIDAVACEEVEHVPWLTTSYTNEYVGSTPAQIDCVSVFAPSSRFVPLLVELARVREETEMQLALSDVSVDLNVEDEEVLEVLNRLEPLSRSTKPHVHAVLFDRLESLFWGRDFGSTRYWTTRRHMVFARPLQDAAEEFRQAQGLDRYVAVHMRRGDFVRIGAKHTPSLDSAVVQLSRALKDAGLSKLFLATDGSDEEIQHIKEHLDADVFVFHSEKPMHPAKTAIIDQILCAHADVFLGTRTSTFTRVILQERELLRKAPETTYRVLCPDDQDTCDPPSRHPLR